VIEDEPEVRRNMTINPAAREVSPITAENRRVGIQSAKKKKLDLILRDFCLLRLDPHPLQLEIVPLQAFEFSLSGS
jgi:hypothetical protein